MTPKTLPCSIAHTDSTRLTTYPCTLYLMHDDTFSSLNSTASTSTRTFSSRGPHDTLAPHPAISTEPWGHGPCVALSGGRVSRETFPAIHATKRCMHSASLGHFFWTHGSLDPSRGERWTGLVEWMN